MLRTIRVKNFYSIGSEQEMCLEISPNGIRNQSAVETPSGKGVNLIACIIGPNASGKTNLLKAASFLFWLVQSAYTTFKSEQLIPLEPHKLHQNESTKIEVEFCNLEQVYKYSLELNEKEVIHEFLGVHRERDFSRIFEFNRHEKEPLNTTLAINEADKNRFIDRKNVPFLSSLIDTGYLSQITFFKRVDTNVSQLGHDYSNAIVRSLSVSEVLHKDATLRNKILKFADNVDLGVSDLSFAELLTPKKQNPEETTTTQILQLVHRSKKGTFTLPIFEESNGTQRGICMLSEIFPILMNGGIYILDEIEDGLHPAVAEKIIGLFESIKSNPKHAQLIFSTHQHSLINSRTKTQIFIAQKGHENLETEIYSLDDVEGVRNEENFFHKYSAGEYGGTPVIKYH